MRHQSTSKTAPNKRRSNQHVRHNPPRTAEQYFARSRRFQEVWNRVAHVVTKMRNEHVSLREASGEFSIDSRTVVRWGKSALRKLPNGRYVARKSDRLLRVLTIPSAEGPLEVAVRGSRWATEVATYSTAVDQYLQTGDTSALHKFTGKHITDAGGIEVPLLTDLDELNRLGSAGVLSFESLYRRVA